MADNNVVPNYDVQFIPAERRMSDRRANPNAGLPPGVTEDRRKGDRRFHALAAAQSTTN